MGAGTRLLALAAALFFAFCSAFRLVGDNGAEAAALRLDFLLRELIDGTTAVEGQKSGVAAGAHWFQKLMPQPSKLALSVQACR